MRRILLVLVLASFGCDKLKAVAGGDEGGTSIVGDLFKPDFEGEITMKMTPANPKAGPQQTIVFGIKKPKYRMDMSPTQGPQGSVILDLPTKKGWLLMHPKKMAMELDLEKMKNGGGFPGLPGTPKGVPTAAPKTPPTVEKTGKKETIAGYGCEVWIVTSEGKKGEACVADGLSWIDMSDVGMGSPEIAVAAIASEGNRFPLRVISYDAKGAEELRMEAQKVEKKTLPPASFEPPADYARLPSGGLPAFPPIPTKR